MKKFKFLKMIVRIKRKRHVLFASVSTVLLVALYQNCGAKQSTSSAVTSSGTGTTGTASISSEPLLTADGSTGSFAAALGSPLVTFTVTNTSAVQAMHLQTAVTTGSGIFSISGDTCNGASLSSSTQCTLTVAYRNCTTVAQTGTIALTYSDQAGVSQLPIYFYLSGVAGSSSAVACVTALQNQGQQNIAVISNEFLDSDTPVPATTPVPNLWRFGPDHVAGSWSQSPIANVGCSISSNCSYTGVPGVNLTSDGHCLLAKLSTGLSPNMSGGQTISGVGANYFYYNAQSGGAPCDPNHLNTFTHAVGDFLNPNQTNQCIWGIASGSSCSGGFVHNMGDGTIGFYCQPTTTAGVINYLCPPNTTDYNLAGVGYKCRINSGPAHTLEVSTSAVPGRQSIVYAPRMSAPYCDTGDTYTSSGGGKCVWTYLPIGWNAFANQGWVYFDPTDHACK